MGVPKKCGKQEEKSVGVKCSVKLTNRFLSQTDAQHLTAGFQSKTLEIRSFENSLFLGDFSHVYTYQ